VTRATLPGYLLLVGACWVAGIRILRFARRRDDAAAGGLGFALVCTGGFGYPLLFLRSLWPLSPEVGALTFAAGIVALSLTSAVLYFVLWRVYRPHSVAAALLCSGGCFVLAWSFLAELVTVGFTLARDPLWLALGASSRMLPYAWGGIEALLQARRLRLEGAPAEDAGAARRAALCGFALLCVVVIYAAGLVSALGDTGVPLALSVVHLATVCGLVAALALWVAFLHPVGRRVAIRPKAGAQL
jgi:hypothetical protein